MTSGFKHLRVGLTGRNYHQTKGSITFMASLLDSGGDWLAALSCFTYIAHV